MKDLGWKAPFGANFLSSRGSEAEDSKSRLYVNGQFRNPVATWSGAPPNLLRVLREYATGKEVRRPKSPIPVVARRREDYDVAPESGLRATWMGHASSLVEIDGHRLLLDPVWSARCSPVSILGPKRFHPPPIALNALPVLDAVIISHDHYDHLDFATVRELATHDVTFIVPTGVGAHLRLWGVSANKIITLDWGEHTTIGSLTITALPARHFSGRWIGDRNKTQWASWTIIGNRHRVYYSGDSGYFPGFVDIGRDCGPFDLSIIAMGAYATAWPDVHLNPEEALTVHREVRGKVLLPVHWGTFQLAMHSWFEPADRMIAAAAETDDVVVIPKPGEFVEPSRLEGRTPWWRQR